MPVSHAICHETWVLQCMHMWCQVHWIAMQCFSISWCPSWDCIVHTNSLCSTKACSLPVRIRCNKKAVRTICMIACATHNSAQAMPPETGSLSDKQLQLYACSLQIERAGQARSVGRKQTRSFEWAFNPVNRCCLPKGCPKSKAAPASHQVEWI